MKKPPKKPPTSEDFINDIEVVFYQQFSDSSGVAIDKYKVEELLVKFAKLHVDFIFDKLKTEILLMQHEDFEMTADFLEEIKNKYKIE